MNYLYIFRRDDNWYSRIWLSMSCRCAQRIRNIHFAPEVIWGSNNDFFCLKSLVTWTPCTLWLGYDWVCFVPEVIWGSNNDFFCLITLVTWTPSTFLRVDKCYSRIWLSMSCRCAIKFWNFYFHAWSRIKSINFGIFTAKQQNAS